MSTVTDAPGWHQEARQLRQQGLSEREIAESVGKSPSSVHEAVKDIDPGAAPAPADPPEETLAQRQRRIADEAAGIVQPTPGQQTIDGGEVPAQVSLPGLELAGTVKLEGSKGGKKPQSATIKFQGGKIDMAQGTAYRKGALVHGVFLATVVSVGEHDKRDKQTRQVVTSEQRHIAEIDELVTAGSERELFVGLFQRLLDSDMQEAAELADELRVMATGGGA